MPRPVVLLLMVLCAACGSHSDASQRTAAGRQRQARDLARRAGLSVDVQDFLARYASAAGSRFEVTYAPSATGTTVVLIQDPPRRRVDLVTPPVTRSVFVTKDGTFDCALDNQKWTCQKSAQQESPPGLLAPADIERTIGQLKSSKADYVFKVTDRKVAGTAARCLVITPKRAAPAGASASTLCLSRQGAALLVEGAGNPLRATRYSTSVDTRRLELPTTPEPVLPTP